MIGADVRLDIIVLGTPRPQGSLRLMVSRHTGQPFGKSSDPTTKHRNDVALNMAAAWRGAPALDCPVALLAEFAFPRPKAHLINGGRGIPRLKPDAPVDHLQDPDVDKCVRLLLDAAVAAQLLVDDNRCVSVSARKLWADPGRPGSTRITIYEEGRQA